MSIFDVLENGIDAADVEPLDLRYFLTLDINIAKRLFLTRFMLHTSSTRFVFWITVFAFKKSVVNIYAIFFYDHDVLLNGKWTKKRLRSFHSLRIANAPLSYFWCSRSTYPVWAFWFDMASLHCIENYTLYIYSRHFFLSLLWLVISSSTYVMWCMNSNVLP